MSDWDDFIEANGAELDVWDGFTDNIFTHKHYGEILKAIATKGNFNYLKSEFCAYRDNAYSAYDDERFVFIKNDAEQISDTEWQQLQDAYVERAKYLYEDDLTEEQLDFFDFDNREKLTFKDWNEIFSFFTTREEIEKRHLESFVSFEETLELVRNSQPEDKPEPKKAFKI